MKVAVVSEGDGEYAALPAFLRREFPQHQFIFAMAKVDPQMPPQRLAGAIEGVLEVVDGEAADLIVIILDREIVHGCPGQHAEELRAAIINRIALRTPIMVVMKDSAFENWVIADLDALGQFRARFRISNATANKVRANADNCDAHAMLKAACTGDYHKVSDAMRILAVAAAQNIAANSRSFRRLCRVLRHPDYLTQSRLRA